MGAKHPVSDAELLRIGMEIILSDLHVSCPARIEKYDAQRADVKPLIKKPLRVEDGTTIYEDLPVIPNALVLWPGGGKFGLHCKLVAGDVVMLVFSDNAYSEWRQTGQITQPFDLRRHGLGYPFAVPCLSTDSNVWSSLSGGDGLRLGKDGADDQIRIDDDGHIVVGVGGAPVAHSSEVADDFDKIAQTLTQMITYIGAIKTIVEPGGPPFTQTDNLTTKLQAAVTALTVTNPGNLPTSIGKIK